MNTYEEQLAYLAGVLDSEASLYLTKSTNKTGYARYRAGIKIAMNDIGALRLFKKIFGGKIYKGTRKVKLDSKECYAPARVLQYGSEEKIKEIISVLYPYIQVKQKQAAIIMDFLAEREVAKEEASYNSFMRCGKLNNKYLASRAAKKSGWIK